MQGAGVGISPFASVLRQLLDEYSKSNSGSSNKVRPLPSWDHTKITPFDALLNAQTATRTVHLEWFSIQIAVVHCLWDKDSLISA